jgi:hypothetical protein
MFETLYKVKTPKGFLDGEYYQASVNAEFVNGVVVFFVREKHGYFNDTEKRLVHLTVTLSPEDGYPTFEEAKKRYDEQVHHRAKEGFVHALSIDPFAPNATAYRYLGSEQG